jgi:hypothetical protein
MKRHFEKLHESDVKTNELTYQTLVTKIDELHTTLKQRDEQHKFEQEQLHRKLDELTTKTQTPTNQTLNIICVSGNDNYLDMLTHRLGDFDQAIDYIRDCALSDIAGDCRLIEKIYKDNNPTLSFSTNPKKSKIYYHNEQQISVTEDRDSFGRKIAHNLQNSYLKGINHLISNHLDRRFNPNQLLADYDLQAWNSHIYNLSDAAYRRKMINQLEIPQK